MKKLILLFTVLFLGISGYGQEHWHPGNPRGIIYNDSRITVELDRDWMSVCDHSSVCPINPWAIDVTLYDSIGHFIREWKNLDMRNQEEEVTYRIIYRFVIEENGWLRIGEYDIPTMKREEEDYYD